MPELTPQSGLIGSPEFGAPLVKGGNRCLRFGVSSMRTSNPVLTSRSSAERFPLGVAVKCVKVEHSGDTHGQDWYTNGEGVTL